ncbi:hypothetical protein SAMN05444166_6213 [Singulisphaera sp. GP187]|uniref:hypothetical protein n=1 Tax=Singulisphaera sp. GP187 TaxID=1882752 RepID=UPI0009274526|nr:hypothetical protein [Singulisphaera sp. GP187]SIO59942.1 hypothetical protein SAMN05444166_6213 [Singulisphaera sp. GP187]
MFVWELVSCRLRVAGWHVWHSTRNDAYGPTYTVHLQRPGVAYDVSGPTLTEAYAVASRRAREQEPTGVPQSGGGPHFPRLTAMARA